MMSPKRALWMGVTATLMLTAAGAPTAQAFHQGPPAAPVTETETDTAERYAAVDGGGGEFTALGLCNYNGGHPKIGLGSRGVVVSHAQCILSTFHGHAMPVDGIFGETTRAHVIWFQAVNGLTADGIVGPRTWDRLHQI